MAKYSAKAIARLSAQLEVEPDFFIGCLEECVIEVVEINGDLEFQNGTVLRLRRLQRLCITFDIDLPSALLLFDSTQ